MPKLIQDIKNELESAYLEAPFDEGKAELEKEGYHIISLEENAELRIKEGKEAIISKNGNWAREGIIYLPSKGIYLTKNSPIMDDAKKITDFHRNNKEFFINKEQIEKALVNAIELKNMEIPTDKFGDDEITAYVFGKKAKDYGKFLEEIKINAISIWPANFKNEPFARQIWFRDINFKFDIDGDYKGLSYDNAIRGVRSKNSEGTQKNLHIQANVLNELKISNLDLEETILKASKK